MADKRCPHVERCELFPLIRLGGVRGFCLDNYCYGEFGRCARFRYATEHGHKPPRGLLPHGASRD